MQLLEKTLIRLGNDEYARQNGSVGLTPEERAVVALVSARLRRKSA